jgi:branched-chain amino acid transport system ATP-binding protein
MVLNTKLLLLDEPTAALAPKLAGAYLEKLTKLKESGVTILIVEQNVREALRIADYVYVMQTGFVADKGEREQIESRLDSIVRSWLA